MPEFGLPAAYSSETPVIKTIISNGFAFDGFDQAILRPELDTSGGRLAIGDVAYRIAVLPNVKGMAPAMLERLAEFCRAGGVLIATRGLPDTAYGLKDKERSAARVRALAAGLFGEGLPGETRRRPYGKGVAIYVPDDTAQLAAVLRSLGPQIGFESADADLVFVQRGEGRRELFFVANTSDRPKTLRAAFRDGRGQPAVWDAMTGTVEGAPVAAGNELDLTLEPYGSIIVAFGGAPGAAKATERPSASRTISVDGPWTLEIAGARETLDRLKPWTELARHRFHSGTGRYRAEVAVPAGWTAGCRAIELDLGPVREVADVTVNGRAAGVRWMRPFRLDVGGLLTPGANRIEVAVTNLLINTVLGQPTTDYSGLKPVHFPLPTEKEMIKEPPVSGLPGPVSIRCR